MKVNQKVEQRAKKAEILSTLITNVLEIGLFCLFWANENNEWIGIREPCRFDAEYATSRPGLSVLGSPHNTKYSRIGGET